MGVLEAIGRANPVGSIQAFQNNQANIALKNKSLAVQDLNMQNVKQQMDIRQRKDQVEIDNIEKQKELDNQDIHLFSNPMYLQAPPGVQKIWTNGMKQAGVIGDDGVGKRRAVMQFIKDAETTTQGLTKYVKPAVDFHKAELDNVMLQIQEERAKDTPNPKKLEALTAKKVAAAKQWGDGSTMLSKAYDRAVAIEKENKKPATPEKTSNVNKLIEEWKVETDPTLKEVRWEAIQKAATKSGETIEVGPDGTIRISRGVESDLPRGAKTAFTRDIVESQNVSDDMDYLTTLYDPKFLTYGGLVHNIGADVLNKIDPNQRDEFVSRRSAFISAVEQSFIKYKKWATGVAAGPQEMKMIEKSIFNTKDSPQAFEAKLQLRKSLTRRLIARKKAALKAGVDNEKEFKSYLKDHPIDSVPTLQQRGDKLYKDGYTKEQVIEILKEEGYI